MIASGEPKPAPPATGTLAETVARRVFLFSIGFTVCGVLGLCWSAVCSLAGIQWNAPRLAPSFALARGLPIYALQSSGAQLGWIYGPVFPCWFLPVTLVKNLTAAFILAGIWNAVTLLAPIYLTVRVALGDHRLAAALATLLGAILLFANSITGHAFYILHVDAVCIALSLAACVSLYAAVTRGWTSGLPLAALAVTLAIWSKQTAIMLVPAMLCWMWREGCSRLAARWLWWLLIYGGSLTLVIFFIFGSEKLLFNLWLVPTSNPWAGGVRLLGARLGELLTAGGLWWTALALGLTFKSLAGLRLSADAGAMVRLLGWTAAWQAPTGLMAALKVGGGLNSFHVLNYVLVAALIAAADLFVHARSPAGSPARRRAAILYLALSVGGLALGYGLAIKRGVVWLPYRGQEETLELARRNPGKVYLPWNPLITIISDHKIYPFDDALLSLWRAGLEPPREAILRATPPNALVLYPEPVQSRFALKYFPTAAARSELEYRSQ